MIDLVLGAAYGYSARHLRPFCKSLRDSGYAGKVVLFANKGGADEAKKWDIDVRPCPQSNMRTYAARFFWMQEYINQIECEGVLLTDTRDVFFQKNVSNLPAQGLHAFEEHRVVTIATCRFNSLWIQLGYGDKMLNKLGHFPVSCVGNVCGDFQTIKNYLNRQREELQRIQPKVDKPQDQASHNYLIRCELAVTIWHNELAEVYTVGYLPRESVKIKDNKLINVAGQIPTVIHQWDRHKNLTAFVWDMF